VGSKPKDGRIMVSHLISLFPILGKHFSLADERGLPFHYLKIGLLEYLRISGEIRYPNGRICH